MTSLLTCVRDLRLVDHHCHGVLRVDPDRRAFEEFLTEGGAGRQAATTRFDSLIGLAVRRWCAPVLGLQPRVPPERYLQRRAELGSTEVNRRFLRATGAGDFLVDSGFLAAEITSAAELGELARARTHDVVRLEEVAEDVVRAGTTEAAFLDDVDDLLSERARKAVGLKTVVAYRVGLDLDARRPSDDEVRSAAGRWLSEVDGFAKPRLANEVLHRFLIWRAFDLRLPLQFHAGYGDSDINLHRADPLLLTDLLRASSASGVPILLLHNYPFHRHAAYLAQVFDHVFIDLGLATHSVGTRAAALIAETLEITPFGKFLFSSDGFGLAELFYLGSFLFRRGLSEFLHNGLDEGAWTIQDTERISALIGWQNACRVYGLDPPS